MGRRVRNLEETGRGNVRGKFLREHKAQELDILALEVRGDKKH